MQCAKCGSYISEGETYCTVCGHTVKGQTIKMIRLICTDCHGVIDVDLDRSIHNCPYCKSKSLLVKGDKIQFIKIKSPENLNLDKMVQYTHDMQAKIKHEIYVEQKRHFKDTAPAKYSLKHINLFSRIKQAASSIGTVSLFIIVMLFIYLVIISR